MSGDSDFLVDGRAFRFFFGDFGRIGLRYDAVCTIMLDEHHQS